MAKKKSSCGQATASDVPPFKTQNNTDIILDSIADGVFTVDLNWRVTSFNRAAEEITGIPREQAIGQRCCEVFRASVCESDCVLRQTMETGKPVVNKSIYIVNVKGERVPISVSTALLRDEEGKVIGGVETFRDLAVVEELRKEIQQQHAFQDIISKNHRMREIFRVLPQIAQSESTVLIEGPSGSGKELLARAIHNLSPRKDGPLVCVNCAALPDTLLESELFGYVKGAFTDANRDYPGRFERARGGTIFLDEIGDISPALQVRLLRVLQEKEFEPLGSTKPIRADVRVISATNQDLEELVREKKFREDLYYRINVIRITLPPLSERKEDIPLLVDHFIERFNRLQDKQVRGVKPEAMAILMQYDYPGNVRELENIIERAFVLCQNGEIGPECLPPELSVHVRAQAAPSGSPEQAGRLEEACTLEEAEAAFLRRVLEKHNWNRTATARELNIHPTTLWRRMKRLGITPPR